LIEEKVQGPESPDEQVLGGIISFEIQFACVHLNFFYFIGLDTNKEIPPVTCEHSLLFL